MAERSEGVGPKVDLAAGGFEPAVGVGPPVGGIRHVGHTGAAKGLEVDAGERGAERGEIVVEQGRLGEAQCPSKATVQFAVADGLAQRFDGRLVPPHVQAAPRGDRVGGLDLRGGGQHEVGVESGVGEELVVHHGEQVVAQEALTHLLGLGHRHHGIHADHDHGLQRWVERRVGEGPSQLRHRNATRRAAGQQVGPCERRHVDHVVRPRADAAGVATAEVSPCPHERRQAGERSEEHGAVLVVLGTHECADGRWLLGGVAAGQGLDVGSVEATHASGSLWCPVGHVCHQVVEPDGVGPHVLEVDQPVAHHHVHHRQNQRHVGAGQWL